MINIDTPNINDLINVYNNKLLNDTFDEYLLNQLKFLHVEKIIINFNKSFNKNEQELITNTIITII